MNQTYSCDRCETILTETTDIIQCECGQIWCSETCAFEDGFQYGVQLDGFGHPFHVLEGATCGHCLPDKCDDTALLNHALGLLNLTKAQLIESLKTKRETNDSFDRQAYQAANYFSTKEKAEEINLKQTLFRKLQRFSDENGGNEIDWNDVTQGKFYLWYHAEQRQIKVDRTLTIRAFGQVYFRSEEVAQRAIETFQEDFIQYILLMSSTEKA